MRALYTLTIFLSAGILFLVEPMVARMILPVFGGSAQVWNTCMVFFQGALLLGYGYAHVTTRWLGPQRQWRLHLPLMVLALALLVWQGFRAPTSAPSTGDPSIPLLGMLAVLIGLPFFIVSAGSSILQRWFAATDDPLADNPYFLYSASNIGSLLALLAYPLLIEPRLGVRAQTRLWEAGFGLLIVAMAACAAGVTLSLRRKAAAPGPESGVAAGLIEAIPESRIVTRGPTPMERLRWTILAAIPSSLLLGVTTYLTTNIAPIPLLWVIPLSLYLLTFILAFASRRPVKTQWLARLMPLIVTPLAIAVILESFEPLAPLAIFHLVGFFVAAWMCHSVLSDARPPADHLTEFYFWVALGGVIGGIFNALIAPLVFHSLAEYPIAIVAACLVRPATIDAARRTARAALSNESRWRRFFYPDERRAKMNDFIYAAIVGLGTVAAILYARFAGYGPSPGRTMACVGVPAIACFIAVDRPIRLGLSLGAVFWATSFLQFASDGTLVLSARSFFGVHRVMELDNGRFFRLTHGNTIHGVQDREHPETPLTYYYPTGPIGRVFKKFQGPLMQKNVGLVGLGVGSLAAYGESGQHMDFFEIDPVVKSIATNPAYFTFLRDSKADVSIVLGDARLSLRDEPDGKYQMIVLDAFSSDAIPVHLLTKEAFEMYFRKLAPGGMLCVHISNHYLDLSIVVGAVARDLGVQAVVVEDGVTDEEKALGKQQSIWAYVARRKSDFHGLEVNGDPIAVNPTTRAWTDDFSNVLSVFRTGQ